MNDLSTSFGRITTSSKELIHFLTKHRILLVFTISSIAIMLSLLQTRTYLNPTRDENVYTELSTGINYNGIDEDIVEKLRSTQNDQEIQVDANLVPNRNNPFNE